MAAQDPRQRRREVSMAASMVMAFRIVQLEVGVA